MGKSNLKITILSMSLLTVMAGAAVAPALGNIQKYFYDVNPILIKMILTVPSLFIILVNLVFPIILKKSNIKTIALVGLILYTLGGFIGAFVNDIYFLLFSRALLGMGVGLIMPLSTGLLAYYYNQHEQKKLMGYSVAMNNLGGIIAMTLSGFLAAIKWNYSFYVYLLGAIVILLVVLYFPKDKISRKEGKLEVQLLKKKLVPIITIFLLMVAFYSYITNFSIISISEGILKANNVGLIMSFQAVGALIIAIMFGKISKQFGDGVKYVGIVLFMMSFIILYLCNDVAICTLALLLDGIGMGILMPYIISSVVKNLDKKEAPSIMAIVVIGMYLGQFSSPIISSFFIKTFRIQIVKFPYVIAVVTIVLILILTIFEDLKKKPYVVTN